MSLSTSSGIIDAIASKPFPLTQQELVADVSILRYSARELFPDAAHPDAAWAGLLLRAGHWGRSHEVSQDISTAEGSYWHGIAHRMEPDDFNAGYWFRRVRNHPVFSALRDQAAGVLESLSPPWKIGSAWDPSQFIEWCAEARAKPGSPEARAAIAIAELEWRLLFQFCSA